LEVLRWGNTGLAIVSGPFIARSVPEPGMHGRRRVSAGMVQCNVKKRLRALGDLFCEMGDTTPDAAGFAGNCQHVIRETI